VPGKGEATVGILGGPRWVPTGSFIDDQTASGYRAFKPTFSPFALLELGYAPEPDFHVSIQLGYGVERVFMIPGTLQSRSFEILLGADTSLLRRSWGTLYVGGGLGYSLNMLSQSGSDVEANSSAGFARLGLRIPVAKNFAFVIEDRYTLSSAALPAQGGPLVYGGSATSLNVGGNLLSIGLQFHYIDSDEKTRPLHP
jgi:hypothetical protein